MIATCITYYNCHIRQDYLRKLSNEVTYIMWQFVALLVIAIAVIGIIAYGVRERIRFSRLSEHIPPHLPNRRNWYK